MTARRWWPGAAAVAVLVFGLGWFGGELRTRTGWDDTYYLLQVSSLVEDGDLDLRNDALGWNLAPRELLTFLTATLPSGSLKNTFSIGPVVLWLPAYALARPWHGGAETVGAPRWSRARLVALHLLSLAFLAGVASFLLRLLEIAGLDRRLAFMATLTLLIGTPIAVYGPAVYTMAHLPSAVVTCVFIASVIWLDRDRHPWRAFLVGVSFGLVCLVRWQDAVFALLLWVPFAPLLRSSRRDWQRAALLFAALVAGCLPVASLQLHAWSLEQGSWLTLPQGEQYLHWTKPRLGSFLFSGYSGLLSWSPVFALAAVGLLLAWRLPLPRRWRGAALAVLMVEVYINASVRDWWGGFSFGSRRMSSCVPLLALGLANLGAHAGRLERRRRLLILLLVMLSLWGCFVANLYWQQVHDLSLLLRGSPSLGAQEALPESGMVSDPAAARQRALRPPVLSAHNYFTDVAGVRRSLGIALTAALMAGMVAGCCLVLFRGPAPPLLQALLLTLLGISIWCHLRLAGAMHPDRGERAVWGELAEQWTGRSRQLTPLVAQTAAAEAAALDARPGPPGVADAYRFLAMLGAWEGEDPGRARRLLGELAAKGYPAAVELRRRIEELAAGAEVLRFIPGPFFAPRRGDSFRLIALPAGAGAGAIRWRLFEVVFDWRSGGVADAARHDVLTLQDGGRTDLARFSVDAMGSVLLVTLGGEIEATLDLGSSNLYRARLDYDSCNGAANLVMSPAVGPPVRLSAPPGPRGTVPVTLLLGRNRLRPDSFPAWSSTFSDLWVMATQ